ncbi:nephrocan-like [Aplochiton taeniatus]
MLNYEKGRDISGLTELEDITLSSCGLEAIEASAFRAQEGLRYLDLQKNKLRLLPRGLPPSLETLNVSYNRVLGLQEPALDGLRNLRVLDLQNNLVTTLRADVLSGLVKLERLYLDGNRIETVQGALWLAQLNLLSMGTNRIQSFPSAFFAQSTSLVTLRLTENSLSRVPNDLPGSLTFLSLDRNQIRSLRSRDMSQLRNLTFLSLAQNRLVSVDAALRLPKLAVLEVPGNRLRALPNRLSPRMETLDCGQNALQEVTYQQVSAMRLLKHLFVENNAIQIFEANALRNNVHLTNLALEQNLLTSIPEGLPGSLVRLDMKGNYIASIQERELRSLTRLQVLNLRKNNLTSLPHALPVLLPRLDILFLDANPWNCTCELQRMKRTLVARGVELPDGEPCGEEEIRAPPAAGWREYILQQDSCDEEDESRDYTPLPDMDNEDYYDYNG